MAAGDEEALRRTLEELAALGDKRVGSDEGRRAADYLGRRFHEAGLSEIVFEPFHFPRHDVRHASLDIFSGGAASHPGFDVLEGSGGGTVEGELAWAGGASAADLAGRSLDGKIALVARDALFHRSSQATAVAAAGARAMIQVATAPRNLRQVGSVRAGWEALGPIPCVTVGKEDGAAWRAAIDKGRPPRAGLSIDARVTPARGQNVVGRVPGHEPHQILVGAHYDTWFAGSTDNGGGVAALLELAARRAARPRPRYTLVFAAWDGEEVALYGGYHHLRRHRVAGGASILAAIDLETPSAHGAALYGLARSRHDALDDAIDSCGAADLFGALVPMEMVPEIMGGVIPTDIQGFYRGGTPTIATAVDSPYYHTVEDTPDKVDLPRLAATVGAFDAILDRLLAVGPERLQVRDRSLWRADLTRLDETRYAIAVSDGTGRPCAGAAVEATLFRDDFFEAETQVLRTDASGGATITIGLSGGAGGRWLHVTAGPRHPLVETIVAL